MTRTWAQVLAVAAVIPVDRRGFVRMPAAVANTFVRRMFRQRFGATQPALKRLVW